MKADVLYTYTGNPFTGIYGNWDDVFGATPTEITATVQVVAPLADAPDGSWYGNFWGGGGFGGGIVAASISDGVRTITPDFVFLYGYGSQIVSWKIAGGYYVDQPSSDSRAINTESAYVNGQSFEGDSSIFYAIQPDYSGLIEYDAWGNANGTWTMTDLTQTPEIQTGPTAALLMLSCLGIVEARRRRSLA